MMWLLELISQLLKQASRSSPDEIYTVSRNVELNLQLLADNIATSTVKPVFSRALYFANFASLTSSRK